MHGVRYVGGSPRVDPCETWGKSGNVAIVDSARVVRGELKVNRGT
jgi:hypothetical protein